MVALGCFALSPTAQAVLPAPDSGYPGGNTAEGDDALFHLTTGTRNTAIGSQALVSNTTGRNNTAIGLDVLENNLIGNNNTATGYQALFSNRGSANTANGGRALENNTTGDSNTAVGWEALFKYRLLTTGSNNIALGANAGSSLTNGSYNIDIGNEGVADESGTIRIGDSNQTATYIAGISGVTLTGAPLWSMRADTWAQLISAPYKALPVQKDHKVRLAHKGKLVRKAPGVQPARPDPPELQAQLARRGRKDRLDRSRLGQLSCYW